MKKLFKKLGTIFVSILFLFGNITPLYAASASISVTSSTNKIVVGNTFTVTIKISSSAVLGSWDFTPSYDSSKFKLTSGETSVADVGDGVIKSKSYTYKFKAIGTGTGSITVKSAGAIAWDDESKMGLSIGSKSVTVITQAELQASYSKNNNLKGLSVEGLTLSPEFNKDTTKYTAEADANTNSIRIIANKEDSKAHVSGDGYKDVSEGENKFEITVIAENGSTKVYTVVVNVIDPNPIEVTINGEKYTVVKRESNLEAPETFEKTTITINDQTIPAFYNEINDYTLIGLKNKDGDTSLYIYNKEKNTYSLYSEVKLDQIKIYPLPMDMNIKDYSKTNIKINDVDFEALRYKNSEYYVIKARDFSNGKDNYFTYDSITNTIIRYTDENTKPLQEELSLYKKLIIILGAETVFVIFVLISILISRLRNNNKRKKILRKRINEEKELIEKNIENTQKTDKIEINHDKENTKNKKIKNEENSRKEVLKNGKSKERKEQKEDSKNNN